MSGANAAMQVLLLFSRPRSSMRHLRLPFRATPARPDTGSARGDTAVTRHTMVACQTGCISDAAVPVAKHLRILQTNLYSPGPLPHLYSPDALPLLRRLLSAQLAFGSKFAFAEAGCVQPVIRRRSSILRRSSLNLVPTA
jgi:hypothetical protein